MPVEEIDRGDWAAFFYSFSLQYQGWLVSVEVYRPDAAAQVEARDVPLQAVTVEPERISIIVGIRPEEELTHTIARPTQVMLNKTEEGADEAVEIISAEQRTILRFRSAMPAEMVDGIL